MPSRKLDTFSPILRFILSLTLMLLLPLLWGDEGCGKGPQTGVHFLGEGSQYWVGAILAVICAAGVVGTMAQKVLALVLHVAAFPGALYLGLAVGIRFLLLHHAYWPSQVSAVATILLLLDCSRSLALSIIGYTSSGASAAAPRGPLRQLLIILGPILLALMVLFPQFFHFRRAGDRDEPTSPPKEVRLPLGPAPALPFPATAPIDEVPDRRPGILGKLPISTGLEVWRGAVWRGEKGAGFGRHITQSLHVLAGGQWLLVHADSGIWFVESRTLARRARLRTGAVAAVDVAKDGSRIVYADCESKEYNWDSTCALIVRSFPDLTELRRIDIRWPAQVRFAPSAQVVASSGGSYSGATVLPVDSGKPVWQSRVLTTAVAALPLSDTRVAYLSTSGSMVIEEKDQKEPLYLSRADGPVMDFPFRVSMSRTAGEILYDGKGDRLLELIKTAALVVDGATSATPREGKLLKRDKLRASGALHFRHFEEAELAQYLGLPKLPQDWGLSDADGIPSSQREIFGIDDGFVVRISRDGIARAVDFGRGEDRWRPSISPFDVVFWVHGGDRVKLRRVALSSPLMDAIPLELDSFASDVEPTPILFSNGDRAFLAFDAQEHGLLCRLPRGQALTAPEALPITRTTSGAYGPAGSDRLVMLDRAGTLLEIDAQRTRVLAREVGITAQLAWDVQASCWSVTQGPQVRLFGDHCPQVQPSLPAKPSATGKRLRGAK